MNRGRGGGQSRKHQTNAGPKPMRKNNPVSQIHRKYRGIIWAGGIMPLELCCLKHIWPLFGTDPSHYLQVPKAVITLGSPISWGFYCNLGFTFTASKAGLSRSLCRKYDSATFFLGDFLEPDTSLSDSIAVASCMLANSNIWTMMPSSFCY